MPLYRFIGDAPEIFPDFSGIHSVFEPGDEVELPEGIEHPRLIRADLASKSQRSKPEPASPESTRADVHVAQE